MSKKKLCGLLCFMDGRKKNLQEDCNWVAKGLDGYTLGKGSILVQNTSSEEKDQETSITRNVGPDSE